MTQEKRNPIIRREKITVDHAEINQYGDLIVTTTAGNEYKIGKKREKLFSVFQPGVDVVIGFSSYMNREYIAEATQEKQVVSTDTPIEKEKPPKPEIPGPQIGMTVKEIGDMIRAKYLIPIFGNEAGTELIKWYRGQVLATTRIVYDGSKLPNLKTETKRKED